MIYPYNAYTHAKTLFANQSYHEGFDAVEQALRLWPEKASVFISLAWDAYGELLKKSRYEQYQNRFFDFALKPGDAVLDMGSGHFPFPQATVLADIDLGDGSVGRAGNEFKVLEGKRIIECSVEQTPFEDSEFDFVYCSHVLEHVSDPEKACAELMRIGKRGYIETPKPGKDILFNSSKISNHRWAVELIHGVLTFTEYSEQDFFQDYNIAMDMNIYPQGYREKYFALVQVFRAPSFNTMLVWEGSFPVDVRRKKDIPWNITPASSKRPAVVFPEAVTSERGHAAIDALEGDILARDALEQVKGQSVRWLLLFFMPLLWKRIKERFSRAFVR